MNTAGILSITDFIQETGAAEAGLKLSYSKYMESNDSVSKARVGHPT